MTLGYHNLSHCHRSQLPLYIFTGAHLWGPLDLVCIYASVELVIFSFSILTCKDNQTEVTFMWEMRQCLLSVLSQGCLQSPHCVIIQSAETSLCPREQTDPTKKSGACHVNKIAGARFSKVCQNTLRKVREKQRQIFFFSVTEQVVYKRFTSKFPSH